MTNKQILLKAIAKAVDNGFNLKDLKVDHYSYKQIFEMDALPVFGIIFSHNFAKAFWGKKENKGLAECWDFMDIPGGYLCHWVDWQFHLQQMVLEKDPIKYLQKFLE